jgi:quercetin dioxygenase-like cupin family protein
MKILLLATVILAATVVATASQAVSNATYVDHDKVATAIANGGSLATGPDYTVSIGRRTAAGQVEVHDKETDTFYVLDGDATFITGGTMIGGRVSRPGQQIGTEIQGGETHHLGKGDVIVIPAGTPHWFKEVPKPFTYYMVKVIRP